MIEPILALGGLTTLYIIGKDDKIKGDEKGEEVYKQKRNPVGFTKSVHKAVNMVTFSDKTIPVGSYRYRVHSYPSDIDIFEVVRKCCNVKKVTSEIAKKFKTIARNISKDNTVFLGDFKAGIDHKLLFDYGDIIYEKPIRVSGYNNTLVLSKLKSFKKEGWISNDEYKRISKLVIPNIDVATFAKLHNELRELYLVRWTLNELKDGKKILKSGDILNMEEAVTHDSIVKIDIWAAVNNNYTEVTNVFYLIMEDGMGSQKVLNKELGDYIESLNGDVNKYASTIFRNSLKVAKRLWIKNNLLKNTDIVKKIYPLFYSGVASLNQIKEEIGVIVEMLEKRKDRHSDVYHHFNKIKKIILSQIDGFKQRVNDIHDIKFPRESIFVKLDKCVNANNLSIIEKELTELVDLLKPIIERKSVRYLTDRKIIKIIPRKPGVDILEDGIDDYKVLY